MHKLERAIRGLLAPSGVTKPDPCGAAGAAQGQAPRASWGQAGLYQPVSGHAGVSPQRGPCPGQCAGG